MTLDEEIKKKPLAMWIHDDNGWECGVCHVLIPDVLFPVCYGGAPFYNYCPLCGKNLTGVSGG